MFKHCLKHSDYVSLRVAVLGSSVGALLGILELVVFFTRAILVIATRAILLLKMVLKIHEPGYHKSSCITSWRLFILVCVKV